MCQRIGGTIKEIRWIGIILRAASGTVVIHLFAAVCTVHKSGQRVSFAKRINSLWGLSQLLSKLPSFLVNDSFVGILKNQPFIFGVLHTAFILI